MRRCLARLGLLFLGGCSATSPLPVATEVTCKSYLASNPNPSGIPAVTGTGITQRANLLAAGSKLVAISNRYYSVTVPAAFYTATKPILILNLHGTGGYPEAEWTDWAESTSAKGYAFIALAWGGGTATAITDTQIYSDVKTILSDVGASCPIASANKWLMGFSVGSAFSFAVMVKDVADQKFFKGQIAISGAAISPLVSGISVMHSTVESSRSNAAAVSGIKSWMYCGHNDMDHGWDMCTEMPYGRDFVSSHGGSVFLYEDATGAHHSLPSSSTGKANLFAYLEAN